MAPRFKSSEPGKEGLSPEREDFLGVFCSRNPTYHSEGRDSAETTRVLWMMYIVEIGPRGYGLVSRMDNHGDQKVLEDHRAERYVERMCTDM